MKRTLLTVLLLTIGAALHAADEPRPATNRPLVGVIRWDGYTGSPHVTQQQMGFLKPEKWHGRAPWFFRKTGDPEHPLVFNPNFDKQTIREITDQEIEYAASAGIDYWAFCYYPKYKGGWQLRDSFDAYLASPLKNKIKASIILIGEHAGKGLSPTASAAPEAVRKDWEKQVKEIVPLLRESSYQKVCDGPPLLYLLQPGALSEALGDPIGKGTSVERLRAAVAYLREKSKAAGAGDPYIVGMNSSETGIKIDDVHMTANTIFTVWMPYRQMLDARYSSLVHISEGINDIYL